jgi:hypothetical protein
MTEVLKMTAITSGRRSDMVICPGPRCGRLLTLCVDRNGDLRVAQHRGRDSTEDCAIGGMPVVDDREGAQPIWDDARREMRSISIPVEDPEIPPVNGWHGSTAVTFRAEHVTAIYLREWDTEPSMRRQWQEPGEWIMTRAACSGQQYRQDGSIGERRICREFDYKGGLDDATPDWLRAFFEKHHPDREDKPFRVPDSDKP